LAAGGGVGALLLLVTLAGGIATSPKEAYYSYVIAFAYWAGLAFASTILLQSFTPRAPAGCDRAARGRSR
jgi:hypothetical protein